MTIIIKMFRKLCAYVPLCLCAFSRASVPSFTLIELMIVMVVISIMVGITIPISKYVTRRAREANQRIYIEKIKSALEDYRAAYGEYPITGKTNLLGQIENPNDVVRHYFNIDYYTKGCENYFNPTTSPFISVSLATNTVETMTTAGSTSIKPVDYCLTYPLMLRQRAEGARPFMDFKDVTVAYLVYNPNVSQDSITHTRQRRTRSGSVVSRTTYGIYGNPVNRPKAIDPVSQKQWKYRSEYGVTYSLTTNTF